MNWFNKILPPKINTVARLRTKGVPQGVWEKCKSCQAVLYSIELERNQQVCPKCNAHMRMVARSRLQMFTDDDSLSWFGEEILSRDMLKFKDQKKYRDRLVEARKTSQESESLLSATATLKGIPIVVVAFEFRFMGGSMGSVAGERFVRAAQICVAENRPLVCFSASGGARMQEGLFSLLQMSKTTAAISSLRQRSIPFISVLTDPTMGGVSASLAMLGDIIIAEPDALIGFAGPRVIEQTVRQTLPEGFQRSEFLLEHGALDMVVDRRELGDRIASILDILHPREQPSTEDTLTEPEPESESQAQAQANTDTEADTTVTAQSTDDDS